MCFVQFPEDTTDFASDSDIINVNVSVNGELVGVDNWPTANRISFNVSKTSTNNIQPEKCIRHSKFNIQTLRNFQLSNSLALDLLKISLLMTI